MCDDRTPPGLSRRSMFRTALAAGGLTVAGGSLLQGCAAAAPAGAAAAAAPAAGDRLVMLGVDGGPMIQAPQAPTSAKPAIAMVVDGAVYLFDCGLDTTRQLSRAGLAYSDIQAILITHHHFDHTSGLPALALHGWTARKPLSRFQMWGPPGTGRQAAAIHTTFDDEIRLFTAGGGFTPFPEPTGTDVLLPGDGSVQRIMEDDRIVVDGVRVYHGPEVDHAYAYRATVKRTGRTVVFSGDTNAPNANLIALAKDCDFLVHEVQDNDNVRLVVDQIPDKAKAAAFLHHFLEAHADVREVPRVAQAANARQLVFCHYSPTPQEPEVYRTKAQEVADSIGYRSPITAPKDLDVIPL